MKRLMKSRWDGTRRDWDEVHLRWQTDYSLGMKGNGPASAVFAQRHISRLRAAHRKQLREGAKPDRLVLSDFRTPRRFLPRDRKPSQSPLPKQGWRRNSPALESPPP